MGTHSVGVENPTSVAQSGQVSWAAQNISSTHGPKEHPHILLFANLEIWPREHFWKWMFRIHSSWWLSGIQKYLTHRRPPGNICWMNEGVNLTSTEIEAFIVLLTLSSHFYFFNCPSAFLTFSLKCGEGYKRRSNSIKLENAQKKKLMPSEKELSHHSWFSETWITLSLTCECLNLGVPFHVGKPWKSPVS